MSSPEDGAAGALRLLPAAILGLAAFWGIHQLQPPPAVPADAAPEAFSSGRAMKHLARIASVPHPVGSIEHRSVRGYILDELEQLGLEPHVQQAQISRNRGMQSVRIATVHNIVGRIRGTGGEKAVLLVSHYDSRLHTPGATDDGSGVVAMLETLRALQHLPALANDLIYLFSDGEELGLLGARAFVEQHPWIVDVGLVLNFEGSGTTGHSLMFETGPNNRRLITEFAKAAPFPSATSLSYEIYRRMPNDTDFSVFKNRGTPGLNFSCIDNRFDYHTMSDSLANIDERVVQHHGSYALALVRRFGDVDLTETKPGNSVYFNTIGFGFAHYAEVWILPLNLLALVGLAATLALGFRAGRLQVVQLLGGVCSLVVHVVVPAVVAACLIRAIARSFEGAEWWLLYYNHRLLLAGFSCLALAIVALLHVGFVRAWRLRATIAVFAALIGLLRLGDLLGWPSALGALAACGLIHLLLRRPIGAWNLALGALIGWTVLAFVVGFLIPGASYLFTWPLLLALAPAAWTFRRKAEMTPTLTDAAALGIFAIPAVLWFSGLVYLFYVAMGLSMAGPAIALIGLSLTLLIPQLQALTATRPWILPAGAGLAGSLLLLVATMGADFDGRFRRPSSLWYALDADSGEASWNSAELHADAWSTAYLGEAPQRDDITGFLPSSLAEILRAAAPSLDLEPPEVTLVEESRLGDGRVLVLRVASARNAPMINVFFPPGSRIVAARVNGRLIEPSHDESSEGNARWWRWRYYAPPDGGFELKLKIDAADALELRVTDFSYGFPAFEDLPLRPAESMPAPYTLSDMTVVTRRFTF